MTDLHRHFIDDITIPSREGRGQLRRVDDVFDCWFESGSMPVAQVHYPFENKEFFEVRQCSRKYMALFALSYLLAITLSRFKAVDSGFRSCLSCLDKSFL